MQIPSNKRREEVATVIRSCLISRQGDVTLRMLENDYAEYEGEPIPFKEFNCPSLLVFLNQLRDTLWVEKANGRVIVHPVDSEKSRHISTLVENQKSNHPDKRKSRKPYRGFSGGGAQVSINSLLMMELVRHIKQYQKGLSIDWAIQFVNQFSYPVKITRIELERQLREINHEIIICGNNLFPVYQNLFCQSTVKKKSIPQIMRKFKSFNEPMQKSNEKNKIIAEEDKTCKKVGETAFSPAGDTVSLEAKSKQKILENNSKGQQNFKRNFEIQKIMNEKRLTSRMETGFTEDQVDQTLGSTRQVTDFCESYNDDDAPSVTDDESCKFYNLLDKDSKEDLSRLIKVSTKIKLAKLIHQYPNGIWSTDLSQKYFEEYKTPLNYSELGFINILDFVSHLPKIFHCVRPKDAQDFKLYNAEKPPPNLCNDKQPYSQSLNSLHQIHDQPEALPDKLDMSTSRMLLPEGVMGIGESVSPISVAKLGKNEGYEEVVITKVLSPSFFWIQIRKKLTNFNKLIHELESFYEKNQSKYKIPQILLEKGLNVVCFSEKNWHRGIVKEVFPDKRIMIHFYDNGIEKILTPDKIYFLHRSFSYLPAQAIPCGLFNVKPYQTTKWDKSIIWKFISKTSCPLIATIGHIDTEENSMLVSLTDTRGEEDFHINDWMYDEKFGEQGQTFFKNCNFSFLYYKECMEKRGYDPSSIHNICSERLKLDKYEDKFETKPVEITHVESNSEELRLGPLRLRRTQALLARYQANQEAVNLEEVKLDNERTVERSQIVKESKSKNEDCAKNVSKLEISNILKINSIPKLSSFILKESTREKREASYFGTISSECGGNERMDSIDLTEIRSTLKKDEQSSKKTQLQLNADALLPKISTVDVPIVSSCILHVAKNDINSTYYDKNVYWVPEDNCSSTQSNKAPLLNLKQRLDTNCFKQPSVFITSHVHGILKGESQDFVEEEEEEDCLKLVTRTEEHILEQKKEVSKQNKQDMTQFKEKELPPKILRLLELRNKMKTEQIMS